MPTQVTPPGLSKFRDAHPGDLTGQVGLMRRGILVFLLVGGARVERRRQDQPHQVVTAGQGAQDGGFGAVAQLLACDDQASARRSVRDEREPRRLLGLLGLLVLLGLLGRDDAIEALAQIAQRRPEQLRATPSRRKPDRCRRATPRTSGPRSAPCSLAPGRSRPRAPSSWRGAARTSSARRRET